MQTSELAKIIDHTLLRPDAKKEEIERLCQEAIQFGFYSVCINPFWVTLAKTLLKDTPVKVSAVIAFPLGATFSSVKAFEAKHTMADELDMVMNLGAAKDGKWDLVTADIKQVVDAAPTRLVKVILETCILTDDEIKRACLAAYDAGAHFVKTSTGFSAKGATTRAVKVMRKCCPDTMGVKASGGIRTKDDALIMIEAGATRLGTSASVKIVST